MLVFFALGNAKVLSFALADAKVPNARRFAFWWNIGFSIYSNSPYYIGAKLWNDLPLEIKNTHDKSVFNSRIQRHLYETMNT